MVCITEALELTCAYDRFNGFESELKKNGLPSPRIIDPNEGIEKRLLELKNSEEGFPDAIFCFNDMLAFETLYFIEKNHLPAVRLIGYDNVQQEIHIPHRLTSIGTNKMDMARRASEMIVSKLEGNEKSPSPQKEKVFLVEGTTA